MRCDFTPSERRKKAISERALLLRLRGLAVQRQGHRCHWCRTNLASSNSGTDKAVTAEHLTPSSMGGATTEANIVAACQACSHARGTRMDLEQFATERLALRRDVPNRKVRLTGANGIRPLEEIVRAAIMNAVAVCNNRSEAAAALGIGRSTLYRKLAQYEAEDASEKEAA